MSQDQWPPGGDDARPKPGHAEQVAATPPNYSRQNNRPRRQCDPARFDVPTGLRRRRAAAYRLPPLDCRCRTRDPWLHRCQPSPPLSDRAVDGYADAARHLRDHGLLAAPRIPEMRVLWRRGGDDRRLVSEIAHRWERCA